jgi:citronellol/citronellal dehydrogenase
MSLQGKTVFITGASRGIGLAIGIRAAQDGANVVIAAKTAEPHPKLRGTIYTAADAIRQAGGNALPLVVDIRFEDQVIGAFEKAVAEYGGVDVLVNNASAIQLTGTEATDMKRYDLMHGVNTRGTFLCSKVAASYLRKSKNPHVLMISPPLNVESRWFAPHVAYTMAKFGMSLCVLGMAEEFRKDGIAFNALWPRTTIATAAIENLLGGQQVMRLSRKPEIMAEAAYLIVNRPSRECTGNFLVDDQVLAEAGFTDLTEYQVDPELPQEKLAPDFFL